jgi:hypothetical protein
LVWSKHHGGDPFVPGWFLGRDRAEGEINLRRANKPLLNCPPRPYFAARPTYRNLQKSHPILIGPRTPGRVGIGIWCGLLGTRWPQNPHQIPIPIPPGARYVTAIHPLRNTSPHTQKHRPRNQSKTKRHLWKKRRQSVEIDRNSGTLGRPRYVLSLRRYRTLGFGLPEWRAGRLNTERGGRRRARKGVEGAAGMRTQRLRRANTPSAVPGNTMNKETSLGFPRASRLDPIIGYVSHRPAPNNIQSEGGTAHRTFLHGVLKPMEGLSARTGRPGNAEAVF